MQDYPVIKRRILRIFVRYVLENPSILETDSEEKMYQIIFNNTIAQAITGTPKYIPYPNTLEVSGDRLIGDLSIHRSDSFDDWQDMYDNIIDPRYIKGVKRFSKKITGKPIEEDIKAPIFLIQAKKGESYLEQQLEGVDNDDVQYFEISKGFSHQDLSPYSLGPVYKDGLCVVNSCWSKIISVAHIEGGGRVDLSENNFWKKAIRPTRIVRVISPTKISVNNREYNTISWLSDNENLWLEEWDTWRKSVALCSNGSFTWQNQLGDTVGYRHQEKYLSFLQWKKKCYIRPIYDLAPNTDSYHHILKVWHEGIPIALVHHIVDSNYPTQRATRALLEELYDSEEEFPCSPYVIAGLIMSVPP